MQVYLLKACQVPQSKLHLKLLQATKVIIALVKDKKHLATQLKDLRTVLEQRKVSPIVQHQSTNGTTDPPPKVQQCEKSIQTSRTSPHGHIQWMSQKPPESTMEERESTAHSEASCPPGVSNTCRSRQSLRSYGSNYKPCGERVQTSPRGEEHSTHQAQHQEEQQLDLSLASLKFTDSSLGESSLHHVLQMVERELSSSDNDRDAAPVRHSTPEPAVETSPHKRGKENNERSLKLVGNRVVPQAKNPQRAQSQVVAWSNKVRTQNKTSVKPRVRNYNIKD